MTDERTPGPPPYNRTPPEPNGRPTAATPPAPEPPRSRQVPAAAAPPVRVAKPTAGARAVAAGILLVVFLTFALVVSVLVVSILRVWKW